MAKEQLTTEDEAGKQGPTSVTLPVSRQDYPSLKLEVEESDEDMNPRNMWQVYALGGFLVLRWIWARWRERKSRGESGGEPTNVG
ncbi:hypothetical protein AAC387_Pa05g1280 [Persea americana]